MAAATRQWHRMSGEHASACVTDLSPLDFSEHRSIRSVVT
jgi:hypothetical protein